MLFLVQTVPYVEISTRQGKKRTRRSMGIDCDGIRNQSLCCRYPLSVDFESFGFDFIIAPKKYEAFYCAGECPYITLQKNPHTHLATLASPSNALPCCSPRKLSALTMAYFDKDYNVMFGSFPNMKVDRCGCS